MRFLLSNLYKIVFLTLKKTFVQKKTHQLNQNNARTKILCSLFQLKLNHIFFSFSWCLWEQRAKNQKLMRALRKSGHHHWFRISLLVRIYLTLFFTIQSNYFAEFFHLNIHKLPLHKSKTLQSKIQCQKLILQKYCTKFQQQMHLRLSPFDILFQTEWFVYLPKLRKRLFWNAPS